jgi:DNA-binding CsgD family transcriptional regulator
LSRLAGIHLLLDMRAGDFAAVRHRLQDNLRQAADRGDHQWSTWLPVLAAVLHEQGLEVWSARVFGLVEAMTEIRPISAEAAALWQFFHPGDIRTEVRTQLGDEVFAREMAAGKGLTLEDLQAIPYSLEPAQTDSPSASGATLTARELEVLRLLDQDLSNPQIAARLVVSRRTVDAHLRSIYDKLGVKSRDGALRLAREQGLIER